MHYSFHISTHPTSKTMSQGDSKRELFLSPLLLNNIKRCMIGKEDKLSVVFKTVVTQYEIRNIYNFKIILTKLSQCI